MVRIRHGEMPATLESLDEALEAVRDITSSLGIASAPLKTSGLTPYGFLFESLQTKDCLLPEADQTIPNLIKLGQAMTDTGTSSADSAIPAAYTYLGQFIDHDITLEINSSKLVNLAKTFTPLKRSEINDHIRNRRTPTLDLDCVYGSTSDGDPVPKICDLLTVGSVEPVGNPVPKKDAFNDLPRKPGSDNPQINREALIGDARNDENLIISQMHVAFLRAHRAIVNMGHKFDAAKKILIEHYQWMIIHDFLKRRLGDMDTVEDLVNHGTRYYRPKDICSLYMPLEFSSAAYRFGHSMIRASYDINENEQKASLKDLFDMTAFSGELKGYPHIPQSWVVDWKRFMDGGTNVARRIDTFLVDPLKRLQETTGIKIESLMANLAIRNLLRGYLFRLPTGQKVAEYLRYKVVTPDEIKKLVGDEQFAVLEAGEFHEHTPLWYYILAESAIKGSGGLGPVGKTIVAETLIGLIRWTDNSILQQPGWKPTLGKYKGRFTLKDFFELAGVW